MESQVVTLVMWAQETGQGAQLCVTSPVGQLVLAHPSSGQGSAVEQGRKSKLFKFVIFWILGFLGVFLGVFRSLK